MKISTFIVLTPILLAGCSTDELAGLPYEPYRRMTLHCTELSAGDGEFRVVINDQATLDSLMYENYQRPLEEWYQSVVEYYRREYPGLSDSAYATLAREHLEQFPPWDGTVDCDNPPIDFSSYTLVGQTVSCGGCTDPGQSIRFTRNIFERSYTFSVLTTQYGYCDMPWEEDIWLLVPKISRGDSVRFEHQIVVKEY